jgi:hypothetical protein
MNTEPLSRSEHTRETWVAEAFAFFCQALGCVPDNPAHAQDIAFARTTAETLADNQEGDVSTWDEPTDAAADELDCWRGG